MADKKKKKVSVEEKKSVFTTFLLLFPSLLITAIVTVSDNVLGATMAIALFFYQAVMIKNYVSTRNQV